VEADGDPVRISVCHCLACQRRTGSPFGAQARFPAGRVRISGRSKEYTRTSDEGRLWVQHFCPECGSTVYYGSPEEPDLVAVAIGAFADPTFPPPTVSVFESRRHPWVVLPDSIQGDEAWQSIMPLYEAGDYAAAAEQGAALLDGNPQNVNLAYNVACCASLAGRPAEAIAALRRAVELDERVRGVAAGDGDFDSIRNDAAFKRLVSDDIL
jgi:hypothetical protein